MFARSRLTCPSGPDAGIDVLAPDAVATKELAAIFVPFVSGTFSGLPRAAARPDCCLQAQTLDRLGVRPRSSLLLAVDPNRLWARLLPDVGAQDSGVRLSGLAPVEQGTFRGGFFTDLNTNFFSNVSSGSFAYWVTGTYGSAGDQQPFAVGLDGALVTYSRLGAFDPALSVSRSVVPQSADFGAGAVSGQITQFVVVPEPMTLALAGIGSALVAWRVLRRRAA